jgi:hypothetical protein
VELRDSPSGTFNVELAAAHSAASRALSAFKPLVPQDSIPALVEGLQALRVAQATMAGFNIEAAAKSVLAFRLKWKALILRMRSRVPPGWSWTRSRTAKFDEGLRGPRRAIFDLHCRQVA